MGVFQCDGDDTFLRTQGLGRLIAKSDGSFVKAECFIARQCKCNLKVPGNEENIAEGEAPFDGFHSV
jgi:hypothetical protein